MRILVTVLFVCGLLGAADGIGTPPTASGALEPTTLHIALLPDEDPANLLQEYAPFKAYLESRLGIAVELMVPHDYSVLIESMRAGRLHVAYFGPASYILCKDRGTAIAPFVAKLKDGSTTYSSVIVGNPDRGVRSLADIAGKQFGYGDPASTSSHLIPKGELLKAGLEPRAHYTEHFLGAHDAVALNVQSGSVAAGGLSQGIYDKLVEQGTIDPAKVVRIHTSPAFPQYPWTWREDLSPAFKQRLQQAFIDLDDAAILKSMHAEGFAAIDDAAYDVVRELEAVVAPFR